MNVTAIPQALPQPVRESRKMWGLIITFAAIIIVLIIFILCSAFLGTPWDPFNYVLTFISGNGLGHQLSQGASDVSKWRNSERQTV